MKKLLVGLFGLVLVLAAAVLVGPSFVDWNAYKAEIAAQAKAATGRDLVIEGDIRLDLLPAPALVAEDVRLANLAGASAPDMVRLKSLQVRLALGPLLTGTVQVETLKLIEPVIELETLADGRRNWVLGAPGEAAAPAAPTQAGEGGDGPAVLVDSFVIVGGTLVYRDAASGMVERIEGLDAHIKAASLSGPFESSGRLRVRGLPLDYVVNIREIIHGRTVPFDLRLQVGAGAARVEVSGTLVNLADAPKLKGRVRLEGVSLAGAVNTLAALGSLPGLLNQDFSIEGDVVAGARGAEVKDLVLRLGDVRAEGSLSLGLGDKPSVTGDLAIKRLDIDGWLAIPAGDGLAAVAAARRKAEAETQSRQQGADTAVRATAVLKPRVRAGHAEAGGGALLADLEGSFSLAVDSLVFRGGLVRELRASAELSAGEITISQLNAQFPGSSEVAVFGLVSLSGDAPRFAGEIECSVSDLRRVMAWLGVAAPGVPADRLRKLTLNGRVKVTAEQVELSALKLNLDSSRLTGAVTVALRRRLAFGASLTIDRLNLDAYMPPAPETTAGAAAPTASGGAAPDARRAEATVAAWRVLAAVDANLKARIKTLVYNRSPIKGVVFDGSLYNGTLEVRRAGVASLAGATARLSGTIEGLAAMPRLKGLDFEFRASDTSRFFRLLGVDPPLPAKALGKVVLKGRAEGSILAPRLDATLTAAGGRIDVAGTVSLLQRTSNLKVKAQHPDLDRLLRALGVDYRPAGKLGELDLAAKVTGDPSNLTLSQIRGKAGPVSLSGDVAVDLRGARPRVSAILETGEIAVHRLLPAKQTARRGIGDGEARIVPAAWPAPPEARLPPAVALAAARQRWSRQRLDLAGLMALDADLTLKAAALTYERYRLANAVVTAKLDGGVLSAERIAGVLFGGSLAGSAVVRPGAAIEARLTLKNAKLGRALEAAAGSDVATGTMSADLDLTGSGRSVAELVASLGGKGRFALAGLDVRKGSKLAGPGRLLELLVALNGLGGGKRRAGLADVSGTFTVERGVARSRDIRIDSAVGEGQAEGLVDLPGWRIDVNGEMRLAQGVVAGLLARAARVPEGPQVLPFHIRGGLDAPAVKLDTGRLQDGGLRLPGLDRLLGKKGLGLLLQQVLPGAGGQGGATPPPPPAEPPPPRQRTLRPEDLLKRLLKIR